MSTFITALIPIMAIILLGYALRRSNFLPEQTWPGMERLTYFVLFPSLLIRTLGSQSLAGVPWLAILTVAAGTLISSAVLIILLRRIVAGNNATFTSVFQGGVRFNTYIMLAAAQGLFGQTGLTTGTVAAGFIIVIVNLWCVTVFALWGKASAKGVRPFLREAAGNPLIIGCAAGWFLSLSGIGLPSLAGDILEIIGRAALPFGLLAVGAALKPEAVRGHARPIFFSSIVQFGFKPLVTAALISLTGLTGAAAAVLAIAFMTPTAPSGYILARQLGGDTESMASIITFQTLLAFIVMPLLGNIVL